MKKCNKCKEIKELNQFSKNKTKKDGFQAQCKKCVTNYDASYYVINKEEISARNSDYYKTHTDEMNTYTANWAKANPDKIRAIQKVYYANNPEKGRIKQKKYRKANPGKIRSIKARTRAAKLQRTPMWLTKEHLLEIEDFYNTAKELQWLSDETLEVDHIVPLQGKNVSGLHVPWNLQILPKSLNIKKGNKFTG